MLGGEEPELLPPAEHLHVGALTCPREEGDSGGARAVRAATWGQHVCGQLPLVGNMEGIHKSASINERLELICGIDQIIFGRAERGS